jgi:hypothetical protein
VCLSLSHRFPSILYRPPKQTSTLPTFPLFLRSQPNLPNYHFAPRQLPPSVFTQHSGSSFINTLTMGAVLSCIESVFQAIGTLTLTTQLPPPHQAITRKRSCQTNLLTSSLGRCIMAVVNGIGSILMAIVHGIGKSMQPTAHPHLSILTYFQSLSSTSSSPA